MPVDLTKGDIFSTPGLTTYAHGVDCAGEMSAGIAGQFKKRWPAMYAEYSALCAAGRLGLGDVFTWVGDDVTIYNLAIQRHWRDTAKGPALAVALRKMVALAATAGVERIAVPRIGAGLGGIGWTRVRAILDEVGAETPITFVVFEQFVRARPPSLRDRPGAWWGLTRARASSRAGRGTPHGTPRTSGRRPERVGRA